MADLSDYQCPLPAEETAVVTLAHGSGGKLNQQLVRDLFLPAFGNDILNRLEDQATVPLAGSEESGTLAVTTDAFVVSPLFFPGGNIGDLCINGTVNDLAVGGAIPRYVVAAFILEEGLAFAELQQIVRAMAAACREAKIKLVAGDTKVVERGKGDHCFITTTGVGFYPRRYPLSVHNAQVGDHILVSGTVGDHGCAVLSVRDDLGFTLDVHSDTAPLTELAQAVLNASDHVRCMRDPTRGGLAASLQEIATASQVALTVEEKQLPVTPAVANLCEVLGLDPVFIANEGKLVAIVAPEDGDKVLRALRQHPLGREARHIGQVVDAPVTGAGSVNIRSVTGIERRLTLPAGDPLPRIC